MDEKLITVEELIKELEKFDKNDEVYLSDPGGLYVYNFRTDDSIRIDRVIMSWKEGEYGGSKR